MCVRWPGADDEVLQHFLLSGMLVFAGKMDLVPNDSVH